MKITQDTVFTFELTKEERMAFTLVDNVLRLVQDRVENTFAGVVNEATGQVFNHHDVSLARGLMEGIMESDKWISR